MFFRRIAKAAGGGGAVVGLLLCVLCSLTPIQPARGATTPVDVTEPTPPPGTFEIKYDDGIPYRQIWQDQSCSGCYTWQAVLFTLPQGISTATLVDVYFYGGGGSQTVNIGAFDTAFNRLSKPVSYALSTTAWQKVTIPATVVPHQFWIWLERTNKSDHAMPYYDMKLNGTDRYWDIPGARSYYVPDGDLMIRAYFMLQADVGPGQEFTTIQAAIDSVWDGWTIVVHDATYDENVTVDKAVIIKSLSGPTETIVRTPHSDRDVFNISVSGVNLSGFTIEGASAAGASGVHLQEASNCTVSGNVIQDNAYGIYASQNSSNNIILENECRYNGGGIHVDGSQNYISGNNLHGNTSPSGAAVYLSSTAAGNQIRFNSITVDPGTDSAVAGSPQVYNENSGEQVSAVDNWWGADSGPSNAGGQGSAVGGVLNYDPWLTMRPLRVTTVLESGGDFTVDANTEMSTIVIKQGAGTPIVSAASFGDNPFGRFPGKPLGKWTDVLFSSANGVDQVEIRHYYSADEVAALNVREGSLRLFWWNGEKWKVCSKTGVDKKNDFVWAQLNLKTRPTPSDLSGTMFASGIPAGGGFAWWVIPVVIVVLLVLLIVFRLFWVLVVKHET